MAVGKREHNIAAGSSYRALKFSWKNWQLVYAVIVLATTIFYCVISTIENVSDGIRLDNFGSTVFYTVCILNTLFFADIARELPSLCRMVAQVEVSLAEYGYPPNVNFRIKTFLATFLILSVFEHSLLTYLNVVGTIVVAEKQNTTFLETFFAIRFPVIMNNVAYSDGTVIFTFIITIICTLNWNYLDFFLISISMEISAKFVQINVALRQLSNKIEKVSSWGKICQDYNELSVLTKVIDGRISKLVLMSYVSNLYHLSLQLLRSLKIQGDVYVMAYFYFSMVYLMLRTLTVSFYGAKIQDESKVPRDVLFGIRKPCSSASRLLDQVINDDISITGGRFFSVSRRFIITMIGTLITYEVILLQFNSLRYEDTGLG